MSLPVNISPALPSESASAFAERVRARFGVVPNFFRLAPETPDLAEKLFGFAECAYFDIPLPSLFKERLFVWLSRFCTARYCIARHTGFLLGLGHASGDPRVKIQSLDDVVRLLRRRLARGPELDSFISLCADSPSPLADLPAPDSSVEQAIFALASHVFLQTEDALRCLEAVKYLLGEVRFQYLLVFLTFVRAAHYWTKVHPELELEDDVTELLTTEEALAVCILNDPEASKDPACTSILEELPALRQKAAETLERSRQLENLSRRLLQAQDEERRRIARDLHDSTSHFIAALGNTLSNLRREATVNPPLGRHLADAERLLQQLTREVSTASYLIHPPSLDEYGLSSALPWYVDGVAHRSGLEIGLNMPEDFERLPAEMELAIFRVVQESLTNILRHSGSRTAMIRLGRDGEYIFVEVQDQGKGMSAERLAEVQTRGVGVGIPGIRERIRQFHGELTIESNALGTRLRAVLLAPVGAEEHPRREPGVAAAD